MKPILLILILITTIGSYAQEQRPIVEIVDELTIKWDKEAKVLDSYKGLENYCHNRVYRMETIDLLDKIHHYDTVLYAIVSNKYKDSQDTEARATLDDIETLEADYTTLSFKKFLREECGKLNDTERNYGAQHGETYEKEVALLEEELDKYIVSITRRIDIIDEHIHHLKDL